MDSCAYAQLTSLQIEQFIESIFPSQKPPVDNKSPASVEEAAKKKKEDYEAKWDLIYMISAVVLTVLVITFFMVGLMFCFALHNANYMTALCCLVGWCSLRHSVLQDERTTRRADGLDVFQHDQDRGSHKGCRSSTRAQRAVDRSWLVGLSSMCIIVVAPLFFQPRHTSSRLII
jgi:hypothetical protein